MMIPAIIKKWEEVYQLYDSLIKDFEFSDKIKSDKYTLAKNVIITFLLDLKHYENANSIAEKNGKNSQNKENL